MQIEHDARTILRSSQVENGRDIIEGEGYKRHAEVTVQVYDRGKCLQVYHHHQQQLHTLPWASVFLPDFLPSGFFSFRLPNNERFYGMKSSTPRPTPNLEDQGLIFGVPTPRRLPLPRLKIFSYPFSVSHLTVPQELPLAF